MVPAVLAAFAGVEAATRTPTTLLYDAEAAGAARRDIYRGVRGRAAAAGSAVRACNVRVGQSYHSDKKKDRLTQSEFQSGRNRTVFCVLVVKLTTTKHFGILGLTRITKKNVRPHTSCMGGGGRRAPPPDARENHVIR